MTTVDVVIPAWNAERFVEEAIMSVLEQTVPPRAVIVVDDGSTDGTVELVRSLHPTVTVLDREHEGAGPARDAGIAASTSDVIAFLDADDVWLPHKLDRQLAALRADESIDAVFCLVDEFYDERDGPLVGVRRPQVGAQAALTSGALLRRGLIERVGPFEASEAGDWMEWWARARRMGAHEFHVQEALVRRRIHGGNHSMRTAVKASPLLAVAREQLRSHRARGTT